MSHIIFEQNKLQVHSFWGGGEKGKSLVFAQWGTQVELPESDARKLLAALRDTYTVPPVVPLKRLFQVTHSHRHGMSTYLVMADKEPSEEALIKALEIDYEPEREETLEVEEVTQITEL